MVNDKCLLELICTAKLSWHFVCILFECFNSNDNEDDMRIFSNVLEG